MQKDKEKEQKKILSYTVAEQHAKLRLDVYLVTVSSTDYSRSFFGNSIKSGYVQVNNRVITKPSYLLVANDTITITLPPPPSYDVIPADVPFTVIAEHDDFLLVNKPAGILTHHVQTAPDQPSLVQGLLYRYDYFSDFGSDFRPGIVHRLDKNTSGILVIAKHPRAHTRLSDLFKKRSIEKVYYALVVGHPDAAGSIDMPIGRHPVHRHKMTINGIAPRSARTDFEVVQYFADYTLLKLFLHTGRTHQIRVHCAALGHPLLGDTVYGKKSVHIGRHALHAAKLSFVYGEESYSYEAEMPDDMAALV